jgi:thiamine-monophosphate kinase
MSGERAFTDRLARFFAAPAADLVVPIGDDAAVVRPRGRATVLCCDPVAAGVHFAAGEQLARVGRKAVNRNLADLAAMGAAADWLLVSLLLPRGLPARRRTALLLGIRGAARASGCAVIGGDVATWRGPLVVTVTAVGHLDGPPLRRSGARAGDRIAVSGRLGGSRLGGHLDFAPPLRLGRWLAASRAVSAAIDVSDGLLLDLATLLRASGGLGAELDAAAIPIAAAARRASRRSGRSPLQHALGDGEDHALLFTVRAGRQLPAGGPLPAFARRPIGRVLASPGLFLRHPDGRRERLAARGFEHAL